MEKIRVYSSDYCPYCVSAKRLLQREKLDFEEINLSRDPELRMKLSEETGWRTVPMIFIGEKFIGGFDELNRLYRSGGLK